MLLHLYLFLLLRFFNNLFYHLRLCNFDLMLVENLVLNLVRLIKSSKVPFLFSCKPIFEALTVIRAWSTKSRVFSSLEWWSSKCLWVQSLRQVLSWSDFVSPYTTIAWVIFLIMVGFILWFHCALSHPKMILNGRWRSIRVLLDLHLLLCLRWIKRLRSAIPEV